jgi:alcohol dehydrogenase class IV
MFNFPITDHHEFAYQSLPSRVVFGIGSLKKLPQELEQLGVHRIVVLSTPGHRGLAEKIADQLGDKCVGIFPKAVMHVPVEIAKEAIFFAKQCEADCAIAIGGGSTIGLGKAIALETSLPILAIPTTYAGSEMTPIYGMTESGLKKTGRDLQVLPKTVIYDPSLTLTLPAALSATSGINAIAHAAEALYAQDGNPIIDLMAQEGIRAIAHSLPLITKDLSHAQARSNALYGAWLCGYVLGSVGMSLHHKLCHTLGGSFNLPHSEVHTVVLSHALAFNQDVAQLAMKKIEAALHVEGISTAAQGIYDLAKNHGAPVALKDIGMKASDLDLAAQLAVKNSYWNPRPIGPEQQDEIRLLLQNAFEGNRPR